MRYLQRMKNYLLTYKRLEQFEVIVYLDIDFTNYLNSRKFTLGFIFILVRGVISSKSVKQSLIASLTIKIEFVT